MEDAAARQAIFGLVLGFQTAHGHRIHFMYVVAPLRGQGESGVQCRFRQHEHSDGVGHRPGEAKSPCRIRRGLLPGG